MSNNSNSIAKQFKMKVWIVTLVIQVIEYVKKKIIIMIICYQNLVFNAWLGGWNGQRSAGKWLKEEGFTKYQESNCNRLSDYS